MDNREAPEEPPVDGNTLYVPQRWADVSGDEAAKEALRPLRSRADVLEGLRPQLQVDTKDVGRILRALIERAEILLDIPDGSLSS